MRRLILPIFGLLLLLGGCGSSSNDVGVASNSQAGASSGAFAQVYLDKLYSDAPVSLVSNGKTLYELKPGTMYVELPRTRPSNYSLVAHVAGVGDVRRNVATPRVLAQATQAPNRTVTINLITHLVSLLVEKNPELTLAKAEQQVRQGLAIPSWVVTEQLSSGSTSPFSHGEFLRQAAQSGKSFDEFCQQVVAGIEAGEVRQFVVEPPLNLSVDVGEALLGGLIGNVGATPFTLVETQAIGWCAGKLGYQNSTEKQLDSIAGQLTEIQQQITQIQESIVVGETQGQYHDDQTALAGIYGPTESTTTTLQTTARTNASNFATATNLGPQIPSVANSLVTAFGSSPITNNLDTATGYLLGTNSPFPGTTGIDNVVSTYNRLVNQTTLGDPNGSTGFFGYSNITDNSTTTYLAPNLAYYSYLIFLLANLDVENAHSTTLPQTASGYAPPATAFNRTQRDLYTASMAYRMAQQQIPQAINLPLFLDLDQNLGWELETTYQRGTLSEISTDASHFAIGNYGGFSLPTTAQWMSLYNRAVLAGGGSSPQQVDNGFQVLFGPNTQLQPPYWVSDNNNPFDCFQGEIVNVGVGGSGDAGGIFVRTLGNTSTGDSPYSIAFNLGGGLDSSELVVSQSGNQMSAMMSASPSNITDPTIVDVTNLVSWSSSNTSIIDVCNVASSTDATNPLVPGQLIFHAPGTAVISASILGVVTSSQTVTSTTTPALTSIMVSPQNILYQTLPQPVGQGGYGQQFYLTGFLSDITAQDLTQSTAASYQLYYLPNNTPVDPTNVNVTGLTQVPSNVASFNTSVPGFLTINASGGVSPFTSPDVLLVATYTDPATNTVYQQSSQLSMPVSSAPPPPPPNDSAPVIQDISPASGPSAGNTAVTLRGKNFTGATSVTVAGRTASFVVDSSSEILLFTPAYTGSGFVPVVVTTPNGTATTNYAYTG